MSYFHAYLAATTEICNSEEFYTKTCKQ